jgi:hypothetical protein
MAIAPAALVGQQATGEWVTTPWLAGSWELTQGFGPTDFTTEPDGHGYAHWHAGVDIGCDCGTIVVVPDGLQGSLRWVDNPDGYGTALVVELDTGVDVWLGHLRQRLINDGELVMGGDQIAVTNNTGNSTGCHLHFETRPHGGRYGTDFNPGVWLFDPAAAAQLPAPDGSTTTSFASLNPLDQLGRGIQSAEQAAATTLTGLAQVGLGSTLLMGGLVLTAFAVRGKGFGQLQQSAAGTIRTLAKRRPEKRRPSPQTEMSPAAVSRLRRSLVPRQVSPRAYDYRMARLEESMATGQPIRRQVVTPSEARPRIKGDRYARLRMRRGVA